MSTTGRAYNLLRAYIGREWDRLEKYFERDARKELNDYLDKGKTMPPPPPAEAVAKAKKKSVEETAYEVLGLTRSADLHDLKKAYKKLSERSLPANFPEGSDERKKAVRIHVKVQEAYELLLPKLDPRLKRFQSIDLD